MRTALLTLATFSLGLLPEVCSCLLRRSPFLFAFNLISIFQPIRGDNLLELMRAAKLTTALEAVNFAGLEDVLNGEGPFTMFLPTNEGFNKLPSDVISDKGKECVGRDFPSNYYFFVLTILQ